MTASYLGLSAHFFTKSDHRRHTVTLAVDPLTGPPEGSGTSSGEDTEEESDNYSATEMTKDVHSLAIQHVMFHLHTVLTSQLWSLPPNQL